MSKLIKRYSNRKLYDTDSSTYINTQAVYDFIVAGEKVKVIGEGDVDITNDVLLSALTARCKGKHPSELVECLNNVKNYIEGEY